MAERYLHDFTEEPTKAELDEKGTECLRNLSGFPKVRSELLAPRPWYVRWPVRLAKLFPFFFLCTALAAVGGAVLGVGGDAAKGLQRGAVFGMVLGAFLDSRLAMTGKMIDD